MAMLRVIDGIVFEGQRSDDEFTMRVHHLGNGHREVVVQAVVKWREAPQPACLPARVTMPEPSPQELADRERANRLRAARRAKTRFRRVCKALGVDTLVTLTYRRSQTDLVACKRHFGLWLKRMGRAIPGFVYAAAFERQERGAWHVHLGTRELPFLLRAKNGVKVKSWNVIRAMWRDVTGDEGNVDVSRRRKGQTSSTAKIAGYLSKYVLKDWEDAAPGTRRFQSSEPGLKPPEVATFTGVSLLELADLAYAFGADGASEVVGAFVWPAGGTFFLASGPPRN